MTPDPDPSTPGAERPAPDDRREDRSATRPDPVRDVRSDDDRDVGWGDDLDRSEGSGRDARWYEEQRPPHWE